MENNQRGRIRASFDTEIVIKKDDKIIVSNHTRDISLNGIFVVTKDRLEVDTICDLTIALNSHVTSLNLRLKAKIVRHSDDGMAVHFEEMELETYQHLKNIVLYNSENPEDFLQQCDERPGFK